MDDKEDGKEYSRVTDEIANILNRSYLQYGQMISVLEMLKIDIVLNSGMVVVDGNVLRNVDNPIKEEVPQTPPEEKVQS